MFTIRFYLDQIQWTRFTFKIKSSIKTVQSLSLFSIIRMWFTWPNREITKFQFLKFTKRHLDVTKFNLKTYLLIT